MPCNLTEEEKSAAWEEFDGYLTNQEEEQAMEYLDNYLFYNTEQNGKLRECVCTHPDCRRFIIRKKEEPNFWYMKHGDEGACPICGKQVRMVALGKIRNFSSLNEKKWGRITVCRNGRQGALLLLSAYIKRYYGNDDLKPCVEVSWKAFTYLLPGKRMQWFRTERWGNGRYLGYVWGENEAVDEPFRPSFYGEGGDSLFIGTDAIEKSALKYSQVHDWIWKECGIALELEDEPLRNVVKYLSAYTRYPNMEMAVKMNLHSAATALAVDGKKHHAALDWDAKTMQGFLRMNKQDAKTFFHAEADLDMLGAYNTARKAGAVGNMQEFLRILDESKLTNLAEKLILCAKRAGCTVQMAANYVMKHGVRHSQTITTWRDYLSMARQLKFDLSRKDVAMPKDLQDRHDAASETLTYHRQVEEQKKNKDFNKRLRKMYEFEYGDLCIVVPASTEEIIMEGATLKHCVGGYAARHFNDQVTILFLRRKKKPKTPFVTIEIKPRSGIKQKVVVRQIHGYKNEGYLPREMTEDQKFPKRPEQKYKWFLDVWKEWVHTGSKRDKNGKPIIPETKEKTA